MKNREKSFFIVQFSPDGNGVPYFMDKDWSPELPDYDLYNSPPVERLFSESYILKAKTKTLDGDYLVEDNLISMDMYGLCKELNVRCISIPVDIELYRKKVPAKKYFLFFLRSYLSIMDRDNSIYEVSVDHETGKFNTPEDRGLEKTYYESIDLFEIKEEINEHLFFCNEIAAPVCSDIFKSKFELLGLKGVGFKEINSDYKYSAWGAL
ncbi:MULTISPECIES: hypothetical protein [Pectobacterium]|uniref:hypothetical protein n=1 Tax=Pectobacterium TaxID=122277 RepID=UPI0025A16AB4|nr:hypothetical protein [Pectobacterium brasiliense]WJM80335.1 hypothetical protein QTI90_18935 [Pectobacterium brasiliense]